MADCDGKPCVVFREPVNPQFEFKIQSVTPLDPGTPSPNEDTDDSKALSRVIELLFDAAMKDGSVQPPAGSGELVDRFMKLYACDSPCRCVVSENSLADAFDVVCAPGEIVFSLDQRWSYRVKYSVTARIWGTWGECSSGVSDPGGGEVFHQKTK